MKKFIPIFIALLIFTACGDDFFETTLKVDPPPHEDQLVLHSFIKSNDSLMLFSLSKSKGILETSNTFGADFINDATLEIFEDGVLKYEPIPTGDVPYNYVVNLNDSFGGIGKTYEIKATHSTLGEISAIQVMPAAPVLISAIFDEDGGFGTDTGDRANAIDVTFNDPPDENNFYEVTVVQVEEYMGEVFIYTVYSETTDVNASDGLNHYHLIDDTSFDGKEYTFQIETDYEWSENMQVYVRAITRDWYLYSKSMYAFEDSEDFALFSEPVTVHTNIVNGLGAFAMGTESSISIEE